MRIAWVGGSPNENGGVGYVLHQLCEGLSDAGVEVDLFLTGRDEDVPDALRALPGLRFNMLQVPWEWNRWYSREPLSAFVTGQAARVRGMASLVRSVSAQHERRPYDVLYQASPIELFAVRAFRRSLPPIVIHPQTHAAGELRWMRQELPLADQNTSRPRNRAALGLMTARASVQRRDIGLARRVFAPSGRFADLLSEDYGYPRERISVVHNPIDPERFTLKTGTGAQVAPTDILFVSRLSVRKGFEMVVELSRRMAHWEDATDLRLKVIGGASLWSDYRPLLASMDRVNAEYIGHIGHEELKLLYRRALAVVQPSHFEPFGLTISESLASGTPVVASDEVGAVEGLDPEICRTFERGDMDAFEAQVRAVVRAMRRGPDAEALLRRRSREEALRAFSPSVVRHELIDALQRTIDDGR